MPVTEVLGSLGSFEVALTADVPDDVIRQVGYFGHLVVIEGQVDPVDVGDGLLEAARYVGVLRRKAHPDGWILAGSGMRFWLGDEDGKGHVLETQVTLTNATITAAVTAVLPPSVTLGTIHPLANPALRYTGSHVFQSPRQALDIICDAFGVEHRVNGDASLDVGTAAQLYDTASPNTVIVRRESGTDMELTALAGDYDTDEDAYDYSTRVLLLGQTVGDGNTPDTVFATGAANAPVVPYADLLGNPVKLTRLISESGETSGSVTARAALQLNRFNRLNRSLTVRAADYENTAGHRVGDNVYVYDPETGIVDPARELYFRGRVLHPDVVRVTEDSWRVTGSHTVAFRTQAGVWLDLTRWVVPETSANDDITVGDLPRSLTRSPSTVSDRVDAARGGNNGVAPKAPTALNLSTESILDARGNNVSVIVATWTGPTQNTDNSALTDLAYYVVHWRRTGATQWQSTATTDTSVSFPVALGLGYEVRVAAVDSVGDQSAWSSTSSVTAAVDSAAPSAPSQPVVTSYLGQLRIEWNGLTAGGTAMPSDFNRVDVHVSSTNGFTPSDATLVSSLSAKGAAFATAPYGATRYVKLVAYDHTGNISAASAQASGATVQAADGDIAAVSVGKLTAGTVSADVVMAGRFATALTGARRELNAVGFQAFDASNNLLINLNGVDNLLTGRFRTGSGGTGPYFDLYSTGAGASDVAIMDIWDDGVLVGQIRGADASGSGGSLSVRAVTSGVSNLAWNADAWSPAGDKSETHRRYDIRFGGDSQAGDDSVNTTLDYRVSHILGAQTTGGIRTRFSVGRNNTALYFAGGGGTTPSFRVHEYTTDTYVAGGGGATVRRIDIAAQKSTLIYFWRGSANLDTFSVRELLDNAGDYADRYTIDQYHHRFLFTDDDIQRGYVSYNPDVNGNGSALLGIQNNHSYGATLEFRSTSAGASARLEVKDEDNAGFINITALGFNPSSARATKKLIRDAGPLLGKLRAAKARAYRRTTEPDDAREHIGFIAEEVDPAFQVLGEDGQPVAVDLYGLTTAAIAAVVELADRIDAWEAR